MSSVRKTQVLRGQMTAVVFDKGRSASDNPSVRIGLRSGMMAQSDIFGHFRNLRDRPARETVTARLLGDPTPDRPRPQDDLAPVGASRICTESGPVLLTFRELEAAKKLQSEGTVQ